MMRLLLSKLNLPEVFPRQSGPELLYQMLDVALSFIVLAASSRRQRCRRAHRCREVALCIKCTVQYPCLCFLYANLLIW